MKIVETIERECCDERKGDLKKYKGWFSKDDFITVWEAQNLKFCIHCGQLWTYKSKYNGVDNDLFGVKVYPGGLLEDGI